LASVCTLSRSRASKMRYHWNTLRVLPAPTPPFPLLLVVAAVVPLAVCTWMWAVPGAACGAGHSLSSVYVDTCVVLAPSAGWLAALRKILHDGPRGGGVLSATGLHPSAAGRRRRRWRCASLRQRRGSSAGAALGEQTARAGPLSQQRRSCVFAQRRAAPRACVVPRDCSPQPCALTSRTGVVLSSLITRHPPPATRHPPPLPPRACDRR